MLFMEERRGRLGLLLLPFFLAGDPGEREKKVTSKNRNGRRSNPRVGEGGADLDPRAPLLASRGGHVAKGEERERGGGRLGCSSKNIT